MHNGLKNELFKRLIAWLLIWSLLVPLNTVWASPQTPPDDESTYLDKLSNNDDPDALAHQKLVEKLAAALESSGESDLPQNTPDAFKLTAQELVLAEKSGTLETFSLSKVDLDLPNVTITDFDQQIKITSVPEQKTFSLSLMRQGKAYASHVIRGIEAVAYVRDKEMIQILDKNGTIYAIDVSFARQATFNRPLPVVKVAELPAEVMQNTLTVAFLSRGTEPPSAISQNAILPEDLPEGVNRLEYGQWTAGNFLVFSEKDGKRILEAELDRSVTWMQIHRVTATLAALAYEISPENDAESIMALQGNELISKLTTDTRATLDQKTRDALSIFDSKARAQLISASLGAQIKTLSQKDKFSFEEWQQTRKEVLEKATDGTSDFDKTWKDVLFKPAPKAKNPFYKALTPQRLRRLASITGAAIGTGTVGLLTANGIDAHWAVHTINWIHSILPTVLQNSAYSMTLLKSYLGLSSVMLVDVSVGMMFGKKWKWGFAKGLAAAGLRTYAALQCPLQIRIAKLFKQKRFIDAMRAGVNPFTKVGQDSPIGKKLGLDGSIFPALTSLFKGKNNASESLKQKTLDELVNAKRNKRAFAWLLANSVASEKFGVDPATTLAMQIGQSADADVQKLLTNKGFLRYWERLAKEIDYVLTKAKTDINPEDLSAQEIAQYYELAKATASKLRNRTGTAKALHALRMRWHSIVNGGTVKSIGNAGMQEYEFLKSVEPSEFVSKSSWNSFWIDYLGTFLVNGVAGERADLNHPGDLAARDDSFLWTNPDQLSDIAGELNATHFTVVPSSLAQKFSEDQKNISEDLYDPIEYSTLKGSEKPERFLTSLRTWATGAVDFKAANYGSLFIRGISRKMKSIQAAFIFFIACRYGIAGQAIDQIVPSFLYTFIWSIWASEWVWEPINRGNQLLDNKLALANERMAEAKAKISQGMRLDDDALMQQGYKELAELYVPVSGKLPKKLKQALASSEETLGLSADDLISTKENLGRYLGAVIRLDESIKAQNPDQISAAVQNLKSLYENDDLEPSQTDAASLLKFAVEHAPFAARAHPGVGVLTLIFGSLTTTYLATAMIVSSHHAQNWFEKITTVTLESAVIYSTIHFGQKAIDNISKTAEYIRYKEMLPPELFDKVTQARPKFKTLEEYADWLKQDPKASRFLQSAETAEVVGVLQDAGVTLDEVNSVRPSLSSLKACSVYLAKDGIKNPISLSEKISTYLKGIFRAPAI